MSHKQPGTVEECKIKKSHGQDLDRIQELLFKSFRSNFA